MTKQVVQGEIGAQQANRRIGGMERAIRSGRLKP